MKKIVTVFMGCLMFISLSAVAEDKVLLIGVDSYQNGLLPLPGISQDIAIMRQVVAIMGYDSAQIQTLSGHQTTLKKLRQSMHQLANSVKWDDRVLIYFSGHGSQIQDLNHDEADGADEVLLLSDSAVVIQNGENTLTQVLVDDEFHQMLNDIPSRRVIALIDACHSGTINKALLLNPAKNVSQEKIFRYKGMPSRQNHAEPKGIDLFAWALLSSTPSAAKDIENYAVLSASHDDEPAISTEQGSLFTRGILDVVQRYQQTGQVLSLNRLQIEVRDFIKKTVQQEGLSINHSPQVHGNRHLVQEPLW